MYSDLREALTAAGVQPLVQKVIDPMLLEYQRRYSPLVRAIPTQKWTSDTYYFNRRATVPSGGNVTDGGTRPLTNSAYEQNSFAMKHFMAVGAVTGFAEEVTRDLIADLRAREIEGSIQGQYWDIEHQILWGNSTATLQNPYPQFDGLDSLISTFSGGGQNALDFGGKPLSLAALDELADMVETAAAMSVFDSSWMFVMSNTAMSKISQILTAQQRFNDRVEVAGGLIVPTYRGIPIVKSSFLSSRAIKMGAVTATATAGGGLTAGAYSYKVTAVVARQGEIAASTTVVGTTASSNLSINLAFTAPTGLDGLSPVLYKVYRSAAGGAAGTETLLGIVDAVTGLAADGLTPVPVTSILDNGTTLIPSGGSGAAAYYPATYNGQNANKYPPLTAADNASLNSSVSAAGATENIYLMARDDNFIVRPYVRELQPLDIYPTTASPDSLPYALMSDTTLAVRAPKYLGGLYRVGANL